MKFSKEYSKLAYPIFTTIRHNGGYYKEGQKICVTTPKQQFHAEIVGIRYLTQKDITSTIAFRDADCGSQELFDLMNMFYKGRANDLILITLMKVT
jgi:hypothetical protein